MLDAPVISLGPFSRLTVLENSTLVINCNITAYPEVNQSTVQWFKDGQFICKRHSHSAVLSKDGSALL